MKQNLFEAAYKLDGFLQRFKNRLMVGHEFCDEPILNGLKAIQSLLAPVESRKEFNDEYWTFWIEMPRGLLEVFVKENTEEEECNEEDLLEEIRAELKNEWDYRYPELSKWYCLTLRNQSRINEFLLSFDEYWIMLQDGVLSGTNHSFEEQRELVVFINKKVSEIVGAIVRDPAEYNSMLEQRLSKRNRVGRIKRSDFWSVVSDARRLDQELGEQKIQKLIEILPVIEQPHFIDRMTADDFFRFCEIGYDANERLSSDKKLLPREKYKLHADMRDEGLTKIEGDSETAFLKWYDSGRGGGHPWEICRGGNSTHISLFVSKAENQQWQLSLAGSSFARVIETVNMALALYEQGVPFYLRDAKEILRMVTGQDYIGLVPSGVIPRYCHSLFPKEDNIIDFMDPWFDEFVDKFQHFIYWYPLVPYRTNSGTKCQV
ncbi:MAG: hypothetical protein HZB76_04395 [Chlamydiae bacterium]|nr:hypothetical protein [Chlamydiota bacterium]